MTRATKVAAKRRLLYAGMLLLATEILWLVFLFSLLWIPLVEESGTRTTVLFPREWSDYGLLGFLAARSIVTTFGAASLIRRTSYRMAKVGSVLGSLPFLGSFLIFGVPIGLWALLELGRPDAYLLFDNRKPWT